MYELTRQVVDENVDQLVRNSSFYWLVKFMLHEVAPTNKPYHAFYVIYCFQVHTNVTPLPPITFGPSFNALAYLYSLRTVVAL